MALEKPMILSIYMKFEYLPKFGPQNTINYIYIRKIKPLENRKTGPIAQLGGAFD
ncbi:MAG: hypothetical protein L0H55_11515 [Candidatus Nitrosocosmicus sp.]|nr:hypothetical protein [Candidatus Nitrosocosmicus sp.]